MPSAAFEPRVALASLSGAADAEWARAGADHAGAAFLGGIALDGPTRAAARDLVARDREEFLPPDPVAFVETQLDDLADAPVRPGVNVRAASPDPIAEVAAACAARDAIVEINAHCRQPEMCAAGCGETLLRAPASARRCRGSTSRPSPARPPAPAPTRSTSTRWTPNPSSARSRTRRRRSS